MAHFAELGSANIVLRVVVVDNKDNSDVNGTEVESIGQAHLEKILGGTWKQTSYNSNFRKNYAGIGMSYDSSRDAFIPPKPYDSWVLDESTCLWNAPSAMPTALDGQFYYWDEENITWSLSE